MVECEEGSREKAQQRLHFLRVLRRNKISETAGVMLHREHLESVLPSPDPGKSIQFLLPQKCKKKKHLTGHVIPWTESVCQII